MKLNHVLIVYKRHIGGSGLGNRAARRQLAPWQRRHGQALEAVCGALEQRGIRFRCIDRDRLRGKLAADLLVTLGGDGTVLAAAHAADGVPMLGVNSMPGRSVGFYCAATAKTIGPVLDGILAGRRLPRRLPLIEARIDGKPAPVLALNDVLFAGRSPAEMMRYRLAAGGRAEAQRSSGVWISAGPGSTAAIAAAGGRRQPVDAPRLQWLAREPHALPGKKPRLVKGILPKGAAIAIVPEMGEAAIFIDGPKHAVPVPPGAKLLCRIARRRLQIFL